MRKLVGWDKESLEVKAKVTHMQAEQEKEFIPHFPCPGEQSSAQIQTTAPHQLL